MPILALHPRASILHLALSKQNRLTTTKIVPSEPTFHEADQQILDWLTAIPGGDFPALIVASGVLAAEGAGGIYALDDAFLRANPPSELLGDQSRGPALAWRLSRQMKKPAYVIEPFAPGEGLPQAAPTGTPALPRNLPSETFVLKHLARLEAEKRAIPFKAGRFLVAHLNEEFQIGIVLEGRVGDSCSSREEGPFALTQAGTLPIGPVLDLCEERGSQEQTLQTVLKQSGLAGYLGLTDFSDLAQSSHSRAELIKEALIYQLAKEIGAFGAVLAGKLDAIILAGELLREETIQARLKEKINFLGELSFYPGDWALRALLAGAARVAQDAEAVLTWKGE